MYYQKMSDMFLDNRWGFVDKVNEVLKNYNDNTVMYNDLKRVFGNGLSAYDWAVSKALEVQATMNAYKKLYIEMYGKEAWDKFDTDCARKFLVDLIQSYDDYYSDVESGKRVGYSAERVEDDENHN